MYINYNGELREATQNVLHHTNRLFRYGDGIFESMAMFEGKIKLSGLHRQRLTLGAAVLELNFPESLRENNFNEEIEKLRQANNLTNARFRISLFRNSGGFYAPENNSAAFIMEAEPIADNQYQFNTQGLSLKLYTEIKKPVNILSNIKSCNALLYVKAGLYKNKTGSDECIILNHRDQLCESISNNIFWIKNNKVFTPSPQSGCILGVMRNYILQQLAIHKIDFEEGEYSINDLTDADEVFLSGATKGIQWVSSLESENGKKQYTNTLTKNIFYMIQ